MQLRGRSHRHRRGRKLTEEEFEALDPAIQAEYKKSGESYVFDVPTGLVIKGRLDEFRNTNTKLKADLEKFDGLDAEEAREAIARKEEFELAGETGSDPEKIKAAAEKLANDRVEKMKLTHAEQLGKVTTDRDTLRVSLNDRVIGDAIRKAGAAQGVRPEAVDDLIARAGSTFKVGESGTMIALDADGLTPRINDEGGSYGPGDFVTGLITTAPHLFGDSKGSESKGSGAGNNGAAGGVNPWDKKAGTWNLTQQGAVFKEDRDKAKKLAAKVGIVLR